METFVFRWYIDTPKTGGGHQHFRGEAGAGEAGAGAGAEGAGAGAEGAGAEGTKALV